MSGYTGSGEIQVHRPRILFREALDKLCDWSHATRVARMPAADTADMQDAKASLQALHMV